MARLQKIIRLRSLLFLLLTGTLSAQQSFSLLAPAPQPPSTVTVQPSISGLASWCYWIVATYPVGKSAPSPATCISQAGGTITINWSVAPGATSYDVLRTELPTFPSKTANIAVATGVTGTSQTDTLGARSSYTLTPSAQPATSTFTLVNSTFPNAIVALNQPLLTAWAAFTVAKLPSATLYAGYSLIVSDGMTNSDCTTGGGSDIVICYGSGGVWTAIGGSGGGGSGTVTSVGLAGTANQITVTGTSPITGAGAFTLSLPNAVTMPGTLSVTGNLQTNITGGGTVCVQASNTGVLSAFTGPCGSGGSGSVTSVSFTGGIISVATPTSTPAFTVAGTSGGIVCFTSTTAWATSALLGSGNLVQGGGAGVCPSDSGIAASSVFTQGGTGGVNAQTAGVKFTAAPSATTAGILLSCGALPSSPAAGDFACNSSGQLEHYNGTAWVNYDTSGGNAAALVTLSFSATPTFTAPSSSAGTVVDFQATSNAPIVLTGNITSSTLASATPGETLNFLLKQDATGGRTVVWPTGFDSCPVMLAANATTKCSYYYDGANGRLISSANDTGYSMGVEGSAPGANPPATNQYFNFDSTRHTVADLNSSGNTHIMPRTAQTGDQLGVADLVSGALPSGSTATTQSADDNSTKVATTAYVDRMKARGLAFSIGDPSNSSALTTSSVSQTLTVPYACTISAYNLAFSPGDTGTITVKFWKVATGTAIPTSGNSINTSGVSIASGTAIQSTTVSDFTTTAVSKNDMIVMAVTAVATTKSITGVLECDQ